MSPEEQLRRMQRFRDAGCEIPAPQVAPSFMPVRPPEACGPAPVQPPEPAFVAPQEPAVESVTLDVPDAVVVESLALTLSCADVPDRGPVGDSVTVPAGQFRQSLYWGGLDGLLPVQLDWIASLESAAILALTPPEVSIQTIRQTLRLTTAQAQQFRDQVDQIYRDLRDEVYRSAAASLQCVWASAETVITCPAGAAETDTSGAATTAGVRNPVTIPAGTYTSQISQADADQQATRAGQGLLVCLFGNAQLTLDCQTVYGFAAQIPNDLPGAAITNTGRLRRGEVTVPANSYMLPSQAEADNAAQAYALTILDCFYTNAQVSVSCDDAVETEEATLDPRSYTEGITGNPITVPAGHFISEGHGATQEAANEAARAAAESLLTCRFWNTEQIVVCPSVDVDGLVIAPQSPDTTVTVPAGTYDAGSVDEANELARAAGLLQLQCQYCNAYIPPACYPDDYTVAPGAVIPPEDVTSAWSTSVVLGVLAGVYCSGDAASNQTVARTIANQRVFPVEEGCIYENDEMWFGCLLTLPESPVLPLGGYHHPEYSPAALAAHPRYPGLTFPDWLSETSSPKPSLGKDSVVKLAAGTYQVSTRDVPVGQDPKEYANAQARLFGLSLLRCAFANKEFEFTCANAWSPSRHTQADLASDNGQTIAVTIPAGRHISYESFAAAEAASQADAQSLLICTYENDRQEVSCWPTYGSSAPPLRQQTTGPVVKRWGDGRATYRWTVGLTNYSEIRTLSGWQTGSLASPVVVVKGYQVSEISKADANKKALDYAVSILECVAQAQDAGQVCNSRMIIKCGGRVEPNPASPYQTGVGAIIPATWRYTPQGLLQVGDGRNYVMSRNGNPSGAWVLTNLGCSDDPVGGCRGAGIAVPPCLLSAATAHEANMLVYDLMRNQLSCSGTEIPDVGGGGDGASPDGCAFAFQIRQRGSGFYSVCEGSVIGQGNTTSFAQVNGTNFTGDRFVVLNVYVSAQFQGGWLQDFSVTDGYLTIHTSLPSLGGAIGSGGIARFLVGQVSGGLIKQYAAGALVVTGFSSGGVNNQAVFVVS